MESITPSANNGSLPSQGIIADLFGQSSYTTLTILATIIASAFMLPILNKILTPTMDPNEPPLIKPKFPLIGHIVGIIQHQSGYHKMIRCVSTSSPYTHLQ